MLFNRILSFALASVFLLTFVFIPIFQVSGSSMYPTLKDGDTIAVFPKKSFDSGDICCFKTSDKVYVKRVIAGENSVVDIDSYGNVTVDGRILEEDYVNYKAKGKCDIPLPYTVPEDHYFVLGDNRITSEDSRYKEMGCISRNDMIGCILLVFSK